MAFITELLDRGIQFDPHYLPSMNSDHLPMALVALSQLGASDAVLQAFWQQYQVRLRPVVEAEAVTDIAAGRGRLNAFAGIRTLLQKEIKVAGPEPVVSKYLPELLPSVAASAFHPIIRLGFALKAGHHDEIASALASWLIQPFNIALGAAAGGKLGARLRQLQAPDIPEGRFSAGLEQLKQRDLYPKPIATTLAECAATSLEVYLGTRNFFALHFVTATQAARQCLPYSSEPELVAALTAAIQAGYLLVDAPDFAEPLPPPAQLDEEHCIKYVYACWQEYQHYEDSRYLAEINAFVAAGLVPDWVLNAL